MREKLKSLMLALDRVSPYSMYKENKIGEDGCGDDECNCMETKSFVVEWIDECESDEDSREIMKMLIDKDYEYELLRLEKELWRS